MDLLNHVYCNSTKETLNGKISGDAFDLGWSYLHSKVLVLIPSPLVEMSVRLLVPKTVQYYKIYDMIILILSKILFIGC